MIPFIWMKKKEIFNALHYSPGSCQRIEQAGHAGRSLACLNKNNESGPADYKGAGDLFAQRCQGTMQFYQKRAGRRAQKSGEFSRHIGKNMEMQSNTQKKIKKRVSLIIPLLLIFTFFGDT